MSYRIALRDLPPACVACRRPYVEPELPDPTYNLAPIFESAFAEWGPRTGELRGLRLLDGRKAGETIEMLRMALGRLVEPSNRAHFEKLEPPNKFGDLVGATMVVERLIEAACMVPAATWEIR